MWIVGDNDIESFNLVSPIGFPEDGAEVVEWTGHDDSIIVLCFCS